MQNIRARKEPDDIVWFNDPMYSLFSGYDGFTFYLVICGQILSRRRESMERGLLKLNARETRTLNRFLVGMRCCFLMLTFSPVIT